MFFFSPALPREFQEQQFKIRFSITRSTFKIPQISKKSNDNQTSLEKKLYDDNLLR